jgi:hypothetical protein
MSGLSRFARLSLACSLVASLGSPVFAHAVMRAPNIAEPPHFAQPPREQAHIDVPDVETPPIVLDRATVRAALAKARAANLARFRAYQKAGVFPSNTFQGKTLNVWLDEAGHFCAAATIIRASGQTALADRVAEQTNFIRLATVKQGPLMDWILTSGLTQQEIAAIQEPFMPVMREPHVVEPDLRQAEDARLRARYRQVDAMIVKNQRKSLDLAVERLMQHHELAWKLVYGT